MNTVAVEHLMEAVRELPTMSEVALKALRLIDSAECSPHQVSQVVSLDQALTANVLRLCNSAYYGFPRKIASVQQGVVLLGLNATRNIILVASMKSILDRDLKGYIMDCGELWRHSLSTAFAGQIISEKSQPDLRDAAFTGGLLHDVGKVVMSFYVQEQYGEIVDRVRQGASFSEAEQQVVGFDHALLGSKITERWNFPEELVEAIGYHHEPGPVCERSKLVAIIHLADAISLTMGVGLGGDGLCYHMSPQVLEVLHFGEREIEEVMSRLGDKIADAGIFEV